jgi:hypothetical protein
MPPTPDGKKHEHSQLASSSRACVGFWLAIELETGDDRDPAGKISLTITA